MTTRTPKEVVEAYNYELWNERNYQLGEELIADEVIRHYPGSVETLSRDDAIQRVKDAYARVFAEIEFTIHKMLLDGEYVTLLWEMRAKTLEGEDFVYSSIEVFRVVDGKIREFWNPIHIQETNGVWG
ncbi:MAG: nuclear transport factor 2 family protein [Gammaproteobacteria bacterium]|nr:nuclear transport factor 2 family protein [Gammaproteobacteria bacterium]